MALHDLPHLLPLLVADALFTALGGPAPDRREAYPEFGPVAYPVISEPAPRGATPPEAEQGQALRIARPHLWRYLSGSAVSPPTSSAGSIGR